MSRSIRKSPCFSPVCYFSNKWDKVMANRKFRRRSKRGILNERYMPYKTREVTDNWDFSSDGLPYWHIKYNKDWLRK